MRIAGSSSLGEQIAGIAGRDMGAQDRADDVRRRARSIAHEHGIEPVLLVQVIGNVGCAQARHLDAPVAAGRAIAPSVKGAKCARKNAPGPRCRMPGVQRIAVIGGKLGCRRKAGQARRSFGHSLYAFFAFP